MLTTTAFLLSSLILARAAPLPPSGPGPAERPADSEVDAGSSSSSSNAGSSRSGSSGSGSGGWAAPSNMTDLSSFSIQAYVGGQSDLQVVSGSPDSPSASDGLSIASAANAWDPSINSIQVKYPKGSMDPTQTSAPIGGAEFYANPMDVGFAQNVTLEYEVYFPLDFDFAKGGKLPGLYGGRNGCSGAVDAESCFSTRLMWRQGGQGELYMVSAILRCTISADLEQYAPRDKQSKELCSTPPSSFCDAEEGMSIGRGAWTFARGSWTTIRQDIWLNSANGNNGGFNIWINDRLVLTANDVYYRSAIPISDLDSPDYAYQEARSPVLQQRDDDDDAGGGDDEPEPTIVVTEPVTAQPTAVVTQTVTSDTTVTITDTTTAPTTVTETITDPTVIVTQTVTAPANPPPTPAPQTVTVTAPAPPPMVVTAPAPPPVTVTAPAPPAVTITPLPSVVTVTVTVKQPAPMVTRKPHIVIVHRPQLRPVIVDHSVHGSQQLLRPLRTQSYQVGFTGIHFSTYFGGHSADWASPKDQHAFFRRFRMNINS